MACIYSLQSPFERNLSLALINKYLKFELQYALNHKWENVSIEGKSNNNPGNNLKNVLTIVDFYIEHKDIKLCVYTDDDTYDEKTKELVKRDEKNDRKLQELGFQVLRYSGKEINKNIENVLAEILTRIN